MDARDEVTEDERSGQKVLSLFRLLWRPRPLAQIGGKKKLSGQGNI